MTRGKKARRNYVDKDGNKLPGVTSVIGPTLGWKTDPLMWWAAGIASETAARHAVVESFRLAPASVREAEPIILEAAKIGKSAHVKRRDKAANIGKISHAIAESLLTGEAFVDEEEWGEALIEEARPNGERIVSMIREAGYEPEIIEQEYVGPGFGGTVDLICRNGAGHRVLVDYKSGKTVSAEVCIQQGAYDALLSLHGIEVHGAQILHCHPGQDARWIPITKKQLQIGGVCFAALFTVYQSRKLLELP